MSAKAELKGNVEVSIIVKVNRNIEGRPSTIEIQKAGRVTKVSYDENGVKVYGPLNEEVRDILKLFLPFDEKTTTQEVETQAQIVTNAGMRNGAGNTDLYTVPQKKKLKILTANFCVTSQQGVAAGNQIESQFVVQMTGQTVYLDYIFFENETNATGFSDVIGALPFYFPAGSIVRFTNANADTLASASFLGLEEDV